MEENINRENVKKHKKRIFLMVVLIIIANILLVSFIAIFYYKKVESKDLEMEKAIEELQNQAKGVDTSNTANTNTTNNTNTNTTEDYEKLSIDNSLVTTLHGNVEECQGFIFKTGGFDSKNIPNDLKIQMSFFKLLKENKYSTQTRTEKNSDGEYTIESKVFKNADLQVACKNIFGNSNYKNNEVKTYFLNVGHNDVRILKYDNATDTYVGDIIQGGGGYNAVQDFIIDARKYKDKIEIYAKEYYYGYSVEGPTKVYADYDYTSTNYYGDNLKNLLKSYEENVFSKDLVKSELSDKLHTVKYTYTLSSDGSGNYYFFGFERIK